MNQPTARLQMAPSGEYGVVKYGTDSDLFVLFYKKSVENPRKTKEANRPIYEARDYIKIQHPGEPLNKIDRPVREDDKYRFPNQWSRYLHNQTQLPEGTPIELLFPNHPNIADNLKALNIFTIEQLSNLSSHAQDNIGMGAAEYVTKAKNYIQSAAKGVDFHKMQSALEQRDADIRNLKNQLAMQKRQIDELISKMTDPGSNSLSPPFNYKHDVQSERINAKHLSSELAKNPLSEKAQFDLSGNKIQEKEVHVIDNVSQKRSHRKGTKANPPKDELEHLQIADENANDLDALEGLDI